MHFLDPDSPLMSGLTRMTDLVLLNLITLAACLPVLTAGASLTAMHYVLLKMVRGEEGYIVRAFIKAFRQNFIKATLLWLLFLAAGLMAFLDILMIQGSGGRMSLVLGILVILVFLSVYGIFLWTFPVLSRFEGGAAGILAAAAALSVRALPRTLVMGAVSALPLIIWFVFPSMSPVVILFGASFPGFVSAYIYSPVLKKLEKGKEKEEDAPAEGEGTGL